MSAKRAESRLLMDEAPLTVSPSLAAHVGINAAIVLQQINYWLKIAEKSKDTRKFKSGKWWTYNTYGQWQEQFPWMSESGIRKTVKFLKDKNLIATVKRGTQGKDHTLWYTINYQAVDALESSAGSEGSPSEDDENHVSQSNTSTSGSMCPDGTGHVSQSDESYATETSAESSFDEVANAPSSAGEKPPPEKEVSKKTKNEGGRELMERVAARREAGAVIHSPTEAERRDFCRQYDQARKDGHDRDTRLLAFDFQVAKAAGDIEGEHPAWCGYRTALNRVLEGWRPKRSSLESEAERERQREEGRKADEEAWDEIVAAMSDEERRALGIADAAGSASRSAGRARGA